MKGRASEEKAGTSTSGSLVIRQKLSAGLLSAPRPLKSRQMTTWSFAYV